MIVRAIHIKQILELTDVCDAPLEPGDLFDVACLPIFCRVYYVRDFIEPWLFTNIEAKPNMNPLLTSLFVMRT
jgi:hypothetical protein